MPQVPYSPVPEVRNSDPSGQQYNLHVTPEMFGLGVARAMGELGGKVDQLGGVAARHAIQFQEQQNQIDANNISMDVMEKMGAEANKFNTLTGDAAVKEYPNYVARLRQIAKDAEGSTNNKAAQILVQQEIRRQLGYNIVNGGKTAATQQKVAEIAGSAAKRDLNIGAAASAQEDSVFESAMHDAEESAAEASRVAGHTDESSLEKARQDARGRIYTDRINYASRTDPFGAQAILKKAEGRVSAEVYNKLKATVETSIQTIGAGRVATQVVNGQAGGPGGDVIPRVITHGLDGKSGESGGSYTILVGGKSKPELTSMTVRDVLEFQRTGMAGLLSTAVGKYQILRGTLLDIVKSGTISLDDKFDDVTQDKAAAWLWNRRIDEGKGDVGRTMEALGNEWEIIKKSPAIAAEVRKSLEAGGMKYTGVGKPLTEDSGASDLDGALKVGRDRAAQIMPGNEEFANNVDRSIRTKYDVLKADGQRRAQEASRAITSDLIGGPNLDQPKPTSLDDYLHNDPSGNRMKWWEKLTPGQKASVEAQIKQNAAGTDVQRSDKTDQVFFEHMGKALSDDDEAQKEFLKTDVYALEIPRGDKRQLLMTQLRLGAKNAREAEKNEDSVTVARVERMMEGNGVFQSTGLNRGTQNRDIFRGQLYLELQKWKAENPGQKIKEEDVNKIASGIISSSPWKWWFGSRTDWKKPEYGNIPAKAVVEITDTFKRKFGRPPTQAQIKEIYNDPRRYTAPPNSEGAATSEDDE